jgi:hypothetical protein
VARVFAELQTALASLGVDVALSPKPQEVPDLTPLDVDDRPASFDLPALARWLAVVIAVGGVFERWRAPFSGRTSIQLWWGAFDFALLLFSGKHVPAPMGRGYLLRYDLDAEMMNVGFYPGDDANPANFYGYIYPQPPACETLPIAPAGAAWSAALGEWVLPYDLVQSSDDPTGMLSSFLDAIYRSCASAGWDPEEFRYVPPPLRRAR